MRHWLRKTRQMVVHLWNKDPPLVHAHLQDNLYTGPLYACTTCTQSTSCRNSIGYIWCLAIKSIAKMHLYVWAIKQCTSYDCTREKFARLRWTDTVVDCGWQSVAKGAIPTLYKRKFARVAVKIQNLYSDNQRTTVYGSGCTFYTVHEKNSRV